MYEYPHGVMPTLAGRRELPQWALQDPADYVEALRVAVPAAVAAAGIAPGTCAASPPTSPPARRCPCWRRHAACRVPASSRRRPREAVEAPRRAAAGRPHQRGAGAGEPWLARYGGRISSEWAVAKALQLLEEDPELYARTDRWIEGADWIMWQLCGRETRNACTRRLQGHLPGRRLSRRAFLGALDPRFADLEDKLDGPLLPLGARAGGLTARAAAWTGLRPGIAVAVATSTRTSPRPRPRPSTRPDADDHGHVHLPRHERRASWSRCPACAASCATGSSPACTATRPARPAWATSSPGSSTLGRRYHGGARRGLTSRHLSELAAAQDVGAHGLIALDWINGNRSVLVDHELSGVIVGLTLATRPEDIYRALIEATAFGTRMILDAFAAAGLPARELIAAGGLINNPFVMQVYADVTRMPLHVIGSDQGPALGAAMHAAVAAGLHPDIRAAPPRWAGSTATPTCRTSATPTPTTRCTRATCACTTTSAAAATT